MSREKELEVLRRDLNIIDLSKIAPPPSISTSVVAFNLAMGGGFPEGRLSEVLGDFSSGKSLLAYLAIAAVQKAGGLAMLLDSEWALNLAWVRALGINLEELLLIHPESLEDAFTRIEAAIKRIRRDTSLFKDSPVLIAYDSLAASVAREELAQEYGKPEMAIRARVISQAMRKQVALIANYRIALVVINQLRTKVGVMYGPSEDSTGGRAPKFYASLRVALKKKKQIMDGENVVGVNGELTVIKSKVCIPFRQVNFQMVFTKGIDRFSGLADYLNRLAVFGKTQSGWYTFGKQKFREAQLPGLWDEMEGSVKEKLNEFSAPVDVPAEEEVAHETEEGSSS
jgi:recombination protein RecA